MQRYKIIHRTYYNYFEEVILGQHTLHLRPREDHELRIESFTLHISPSPNLLWHRDVEGNSVCLATFDTHARQLMIETDVVIQQFNESPLDFLVADYAVDYPFRYQAGDTFVLSPYMALPGPETIESINRWNANFLQISEPIQTYSLLQRLTEYIFRTLSYQIREEPGVQTALQTLASGAGCCRDFAMLFMEAARCLGLACRFVSGYLHAPLMAHTIGATHAWAEVYLPGAGWIGFDPTIGQVAGPDHIVVAVARLPESVPPIEGTFFGVQNSTLDVGVWVSKC